jgi:hypothetical protein
MLFARPMTEPNRESAIREYLTRKSNILHREETMDLAERMRMVGEIW